jgi:fructoselysine-6-P-deglycase FrlB-like protein
MSGRSRETGPGQGALAAIRPDGPDEMGRELAEGPTAVAGTLAEVERLRGDLDRVLHPDVRVVMVGTGASLAMARIAAPAWLRSGHETVVRQSTEAALDIDGETFRRDDVVIAISQSGGSPETVSAATLARRAGCRIVAVTADGSSALAGLGEIALVTPSGHEEGAATKSELSALAGLLAMAGTLPADDASRVALRTSLEAVVADWGAAARLGPLLASAERTWLVGLGMGGSIAGAGGLLWHEKVHRAAVAATVSEFRHGPIEAAGPRDAVVLVDVDPRPPALASYLDRLRDELARIGTALVEIAASAQGDGRARGNRIPLTAAPGPAAALDALLRMQQLARATAHAAGTYHDGFRVLRAIVGAAPPLV